MTLHSLLDYFVVLRLDTFPPPSKNTLSVVCTCTSFLLYLDTIGTSDLIDKHFHNFQLSSRCRILYSVSLNYLIKKILGKFESKKIDINRSLRQDTHTLHHQQDIGTMVYHVQSHHTHTNYIPLPNTLIR